MQQSTVLVFVTSVAWWSFVPHPLTTALVTLYFNILQRPLPDPTALRHTRTYKRVYAFISACYLLFSLFQIALTQESNFYQLLGVGVDANQSGLKSAYRSLAKQFHPDRAGARSAEVFMRARKGYEVLMDPTARFAYDRFGPLALSFGDIHSEREYLRAGLLQCTAFYACSILAMMAYAMFGDSNSGGAWRLLFFIYLVCAEVSLYWYPIPWTEDTSTGVPLGANGSATGFPLVVSLLRVVFPQWLPFQIIAFLRDLFVTIAVALTQLMPVLTHDEDNPAVVARRWTPAVQQLLAAITKADKSTTRILQRELTAIQGSSTMSIPDTVGTFPGSHIISLIRDEAHKYVIDAMLSTRPLARTAWLNAVQLRRKYGRGSGQSDCSTSSDEDERCSVRAGSVPPTLSPTSLRFISLPNSQARGYARAVSLPPGY